MKSILTRAALAAVLLMAAVPGHAQRIIYIPRFLANLEIGYGYSVSPTDYIIKEQAVREDGRVYDTTITSHTQSKGGLSYSLGTSFPLKRLGRKSTLALGVTAMYNLYLWDYGVPTSGRLSDSGIRFNYSDNNLFNGVTFNAGVALTADVKFGVDAIMDKRIRWCWTGGIGVLPTVSATTDVTLASSNTIFGVQPVLKTEVGVRAGIVMKLRLQYAIGNLTYLDNSGAGYFANSKQTTQLKGKGNFNVSFIIMPFSFAYPKSMWYNSY